MTTRAVSTERIELDHGVVHAMGAGSGRDLLFLHPGPGAGPWNDFYGRLADDYEVVVPDHPGYGASDDFPELVGIDGLAQHYRELIDRAGLQRPILVGASFGGWIAAELASRFPEVTDVLVLMAPIGLNVPGAPFADVFSTPPHELAPLLFHDSEFARSLPAPSPDAVRSAVRHRAALERFARSPLLHDPRLDRRLGRVSARTAVLAPESDRIVPRAVAERFAHRIPHASLHVVPGYGHALYNERPQPLADLVVDAIKHLEEE